MRFYVIYSFDCRRDQSVKNFQPPHITKWDLTEGDDQYENGKHRKYVAELSKEEFIEFVDHVGLYSKDVETMGSLTGFGWLPAISFDGDCYDYSDPTYQNAYVTPIPEVEIKRELKDAHRKRLQDRYWKMIRKAVINQFGY
jgi:hypothetical protein